MTAPDIPGVLITNREIYDAVVRLGASVDKSTEVAAGLKDQVVDHEARIRAMERGRWPLPALAVVVSLVSLALALLPRLIH